MTKPSQRNDTRVTTRSSFPHGRRRLSLVLALLVTGLLSALPLRGTAQTTSPAAPVPDSLVQKLPAAYHEAARRFITVPQASIDTYMGLAGDRWLQSAMYLIARVPEGATFLTTQIEQEPSGAIRAVIIRALSGHYRTNVSERAQLEKRIAGDPDAEVSLAALEILDRIRRAEITKLVEGRLALAKTGNDTAGLAKIRKKQLASYMWYGDTRLPAWAYDPPPLFAAKPAGQPVRVLAFGDYGTGAETQIKAAAAMRAYHAKHPFDFAVTLGDNFYGVGLNHPGDPRWQSEFESLYGPMGVTFYPTFGNHDYGDPDSPAAELAYTKKSKIWNFPAPYYTYTAGAVQFFAIDTVRLSDDQLTWLDDALAKSTARWKVVYGHYQIYSATRGDEPELIERLLPILKTRKVDAYINGHDHNLQELQTEEGVHFFVAGAGGAGLYEMKPTYKRSHFKAKRYGFAVIEADAEHLDVLLVNDDGEVVHRSNVNAGASSNQSKTAGAGRGR